MAKEPTDRFANVTEFADALEEASKPPVGRTLRTFTGHSDRIRSVSWSPDGTCLASASNDNTVRIWDVETGRYLCTYSEHMGYVEAVVWSPDGSRIASVGSDELRVWRVEQVSEGPLQNHMALNPDSMPNAAEDNDETVPIGNWRPPHLQCITLAHYPRTIEGVLAVAWSPDGKYIASAGSDKKVQIWDADIAKRRKTFSDAHSREINTLAWSPDGKYIASGSYDSTLRVYDFYMGSSMWPYTGHKLGCCVYSLAWSPDGKFIASGSYDSTVHVRELVAKQVLVDYRGHSEGVFAVAWSTSGQFIASGGDDKTVQVWEATTGNRLFTYTEHTDKVRTLAWSPDGRRIASGGLDNTIRIWQAIRE